MTQQDPNAQLPEDPKGGDPAPADPNSSAPSEELKPLTEEEMADMSTEEITAHAEKLEAQIKSSNKQTPDQIRENQIKRLQKAQEKAFAPASDSTTEPTGKAKSNEIAQADLLTLGKTDFDIGSDQQKVLQWYVDNGKVASYKEALDHPAVKAELEAIEADNNATAVIDENDPDDVKLQTKKEAVANAKATGEIPDDPEIQKAIVEDSLSNMSALK